MISLASSARIRSDHEQNWVGFLKANSKNLSLDKIHGSSPPSVFVGHYGYPKVRMGPMIPPFHGDTAILDRSELWVGKSLEEIKNYRLSLVLGTMGINAYDFSGRYLEDMRELVMSKRSVESEAIFEKKPVPDIQLKKEFQLNTTATPFGPAAPLKYFRASSLSADHRIESAFYDTDLKAADALMKMYINGIETSIIQRVFSMGMLGLKKKRKLIPTRWSISATDDIISRMLVKCNERNPTINLFEVTRYSHFANYYSIVLLPDDNWNFEIMEYWFTNSGQTATATDYEQMDGFNHKPRTAGAFFAARLAIAEHLMRRHRKAAALIIREIHPEYMIPLGVWQVREGVREALKKPAQKFESLDRALSFACSYMSISKNEVAQQSRLWKLFKVQTKITDFD